MSLYNNAYTTVNVWVLFTLLIIYKAPKMLKKFLITHIMSPFVNCYGHSVTILLASALTIIVENFIGAPPQMDSEMARSDMIWWLLFSNIKFL